MNDEALQVLKSARKLISRKKNWCKDVYTRTNKGVESYCMAGAVRQATGGYEPHVVMSLLRRAIKKLTRGRTNYIAAFNDSPNRKHVQVLKAYDIAIGIAKKEKL